MMMNLPDIPPEYAWRVENRLHTEDLGPDQVRVAIVRMPTRRWLHRDRVELSKTFTCHNSAKREAKIEHAARKLWKKFQADAYASNEAAHMRYLADENMRIARVNSNV